MDIGSNRPPKKSLEGDVEGRMGGTGVEKVKANVQGRLEARIVS